MSVPVDLDKLADALADFTFAYLITVGDDFRAHTVAVQPALRDGVLVAGRAGAVTRANIAARQAVTLLWPPRALGGYSLIVDGQAQPVGGDAVVRVTPGRAVLHRPASPETPPQRPGCVDDCMPL